MKDSTRVITWIERHVRVPDGKDLGKPLKLRPWQKRIIRGIYDGSTRRAVISVGRKNAKSTLAAILLLVHLCGPMARRNSELYSSALSRDQAAILFKIAAKIVRQSEILREHVTIRDTLKQLYCEGLGTLYCALSADASTNFGLSPVFVVHDELGQVRGPDHPLFEALETATAAQEAPLSIIISTQAPTDADLLSVLIDDAQQDKSKRTQLFLWAADEKLDPFSKEAIRQANPAFGDFMNTDEVLNMAEEARRMPTRESQYRNLILNQRVEAAQIFIPLSIWESNGLDPEDGSEIYAGLDLSETNDLTALVMVSVKRNVFHVKPVFWLPEEGLTERSRSDRVPYDTWAKQGYLHTTPGRSVEYDYVANEVADLFKNKRVRKIAFDRYNMRHFKPCLIRSGLSESIIEERFKDFGQGFVSMSPALRTLESLLLSQRIRHGMHPILTMCNNNAVIKMDEAGNRKLDKKRSRGRIDGIVALCMACSVASEDKDEKKVFPVSRDSITERINA